MKTCEILESAYQEGVLMNTGKSKKEGHDEQGRLNISREALPLALYLSSVLLVFPMALPWTQGLYEDPSQGLCQVFQNLMKASRPS